MALTYITTKRATSSAIKTIQREFHNRGKQIKHTIGYQGGQTQSRNLYAVENAQIWFSYYLLENRHWCAFGTLPLPNSGNAPIVVEINPSIEGINRRISGLFATDNAGTVTLCHTGRIGGGKKGVGKIAFLEWYDRRRVSVVAADGRITQAFPIAEVSSRSPRCIEQIADFVWAVADFKAGRIYQNKLQGNKIFQGATDEFEGSKDVAARSAYTASCDHGIVRNRLADIITETGWQVSRDQKRDLLVGKHGKPKVELEIKTSADTQSIYTAVGQLLVHRTVVPVKQSVVVLPHPVGPKMAKAIKTLNIDLVTYRWTKTRIHFIGLNHIIPGSHNSAPINRDRK